MLKCAVVIGTLPYGRVMVLMGVALIKGIYLDGLREKQGVATTIADASGPPANPPT